jgi:hypothetical protein
MTEVEGVTNVQPVMLNPSEADEASLILDNTELIYLVENFNMRLRI